MIGAGIAGLAAGCELGRAGVSVCILEARDRIGGRIFDTHDPVCDTNIPLGAEFIHGVPTEIWDPLRNASVQIEEVEGTNWCVSHGQLCACDFFSQVEAILDKMDDSQPDESFVDFLAHCCNGPRNDPSEEEAKQRALGYVVGFNAADAAQVGVHWLAQEARAEERIQGDRAFRPHGGYGGLVEIFQKQSATYGVAIRTGAVVKTVTWTDHAEVTIMGVAGSSPLRARRVLVTLPLGVLKAPAGQTGAISFVPPLPPTKIDAWNRLEMGKVIRTVLRFRERFWDDILPSSSNGTKTLSDMGFLFSQDEWFPTWWTTMPQRLPIITGWAPAHSAERLSGRDRSFVIERSLRTLGKLLQTSAHKLEGLLEAAYFHDWQSDPFSCGAYSYGKVGADGAQQMLGAPVDDVLFFAGEATDISGNNGTVHGAIASGYRAAREILRR